MTTIANLVIKLGMDTSDVGNSISDVGKKVSKVGSTLTKNVTAPIVAVGGASFKMAADFETSTTKMVALAGVPREQVEAWEPAIRSAARQFGKSGAEAADALFYIVSAGLEGDAAMAALESSLKASAVGLGSVEEVATLAVKAVAGYGEGVITAAEATDILGAAASAAVFPPEEMAAALTNVIPLGAEMGIGFDQLAGVMAILSTSTNSASEASTRMTAIMRSVLAPSQQAQKILDDVGVSTEDLAAMMGEDMVGALHFLDDALDGNTEQMSRVLGSSEALQGALGILGRDADEVAAIMGTTADAAGFVDGALGEVSQTAEHQMRVSMAEVKDLLLDIGQTVLPIVVDALRTGAEFVRGLADRWRDLSPETQKFIVQAALVAAAVGPVLLIVGKLIGLLGSLVGAFGTVIKIFGVLSKVLLANPWVLVAAAIIALVVVVVKNWDKIKKVISKAWEFIKNVTSTVWNAIKNFITGLISSIGNVIKNGVTAYVNFWRQLPGRILSAISSLVSRVTSFFGKVISGGRKAFSSGVSSLIAFVRGIPRRIIGAIPNPGGMLLGIGKAIVQGLINGIKNMMGGLGKVVGGIGGFIKKLKGPLPKDRKMLVPEGTAIMGGLIGSIRDSLPGLRAALQGVNGQIHAGVDADVSARVSAPPAEVRITLAGDGSARADFIIEEVRRAVEQRGGNVQMTLGRRG